MRCVHESQMHTYNSYITLTYNDEHLPGNLSLHHRDFVLFMKKLRNEINKQALDLYLAPLEAMESQTLLVTLPANNKAVRQSKETATEAVKKFFPMPEIKFYMAGEYGELYGRPHYHALLFGVDFADQLYHGRTKAGEKIYTSPTLDKIWGRGYASIGKVTFQSAAYISRYVMKKLSGDGNKKQYEIQDLETGEVIKQDKEYNCMSRASGIGEQWLQTYKADVYSYDKVITKQGRELKPPRYYDKLYRRMDKAHLAHLKHARELEAQAHEQDHTTERLAVQEEVATQKARFQRRNLE